MRRYTVSIDDRSFVIDVLETASDRFEVSVDGQTFEATLRGDHDLPGSVISPEITSSEARSVGPSEARSGGAPTTGMPAPGPGTRPATPTQSPTRGFAAPGGRVDGLTAPMPGVILEVMVAVGTTLHRGDPVLILEAMKMRNTIHSPRDAVVVEIAVAAGQPVGSGDLLVRLGDAPG
jgi:biotin carboxyl carrier protein